MKRGLAINCIAMIREATGRLPKPREASPLIESVWSLAGFDPESFERPIREALALFRKKNGSRNYTDSLAIGLATSQHHFPLRDPFTRS
jgi:hypothetical protein